MLTLQGSARIFCYQEPMDMRKGFEGLSNAVEKAFGDQLTSGAYFVFINKRSDRVKVLYWDSDGLVLWYKRLEKGTFRRKAGLIGRREFVMLLEGIEPKAVQKRYVK